MRNAREAGARHIFVATQKTEGRRLITIVDDGAGIPALQQERNNARWLVREGIGWVAGENCVEDIAYLLKHEDELQAARTRMGQMKRQLEAESLNRMMEAIVASQEVAV